MIIHSHRLIISPTRRVGGTSVAAALRPYFSRAEDSERFNLGVLSGTAYGESYPQHGDWLQEVMHGPFGDYKKVLMVRNPFSRLLSAYQVVRRSPAYPVPDKGFRDFVLRRETFRPQGKNIWLWDHTWRTMSEMSHIDGTFQFDALVRYEALASNFRDLCRSVGLPELTLPHHNSTKSTPLDDVYDEETVGIVADHFRADLENFQYSFPVR